MIFEEMIVRQLVKKTRLAECWCRTYLDSEANFNSARVIAQRGFARYLKRHPNSYE